MTAEQMTLDAPEELEQIAALMVGDPLHGRDVMAVIDAIRTAARAHGRLVDQNEVRDRIPAWVYPKVVGVTYNRLRAAGVIAFVPAAEVPGCIDVKGRAFNVSRDRRGRNAGRPQPLYRWQVEL